MREAIVRSDQHKRAADPFRRRYSLTWIDFLVIAVTVLTLAAVADAAGEAVARVIRAGEAAAAVHTARA